MEKAEIYKKAWEKWPQLQWLMVIEECAELQKAVSKYIRHGANSVTVNKIADEVADVEIMCEQIRSLSPENSELITRFKKYKLERLEKMLDD